jgi:uncharacterized protein (TIGR02246 family)
MNDQPEETIGRFVHYVRERDLDKLVALYEPDAVLSPQPGAAATGHAAIRAVMEGLLALRPILDVVPAQTHRAGDLALVTNDWTLEGKAPDGSAIAQTGRSAVVLRRQADGAWLIAIDRL